MTAPVIAFFNNKGGVGKTSLVYHLAWMYADQGLRIVAADLDPQANLTAAFLTEHDLERLWPFERYGAERHTVWGSIAPLQQGIGDIAPAALYPIGREPGTADELVLIPGDLELSSFEDDLSSEWPACLDRKPRAFRVVGAFGRLLREAATRHRADVVLVDVGPNLGAINRAALVASDHVVIPLAPDLFSLQGLRNLGPTLRRWREEWKDRLERRPAPEIELPGGAMEPLGYVVLQHGVRLDRPVKAYQRWMNRIPEVFRSDVVATTPDSNVTVANDPYCLAQLKHYHSLIPLAQEANKPVFALKPSDGAFGGHARAAQRAYGDFDELGDAITKAARRRNP